MNFSRLKTRSYLGLILLLALTIGAVFLAKNIKINYDFERFFPKEDPQLQQYLAHSQQFKQEDDDFLFIGIVSNQGIFNPAFIEQLENLGTQIQNIKGVEKIFSPCHNCFFIESAGWSGYEKRKCLEIGRLKSDSIRVYRDEKLANSIFSKDKKSILLYVSIDPSQKKTANEQLLNEINVLLENSGFKQFHIAGKIITVAHYTNKMEAELSFFFFSSILLVCLFLWISYRSWWAILIPLIIILSTILWTVAVMAMTGKDFDILMVMLPTIIFVVGMSDLVHFLNRYIEELRGGNNKITAIKISFKEVGLATLLTSFTTSIGFFSLLAVDIIPIQEFGVYSGISVIIAYLLSFMSLPLFLIILPKPKKLLSQHKSSFWKKTLSNSFLFVIKNQSKIILSAIFVLLLGIIGTSQLKVNTFLIEDLSDKDPLKQSYLFFENNFSGVRPVEVALRTGPKANNILSFEVAKEIEQLETYLSKNYSPDGVGFQLSVLDPIKYLYSIKHNNSPKYFKLPKKEKTYLNLLSQIQQFSGEIEENHFINADSSAARIAGKIHDIGSFAIKKENHKLQQFITDSINSDFLSVKLTGTATLLDKNNDKLSSNILQGLFIAFVIIGIVFGFIYRTWSIVLISLVVNVLPLLTIASLMAVIGFDIKTSTALIFTLAFGIAVDDTIHLLSKLKLELRKGTGLIWALKKSYLSTGKAIIVTSLILCGGFLTLITSDFSSVYSMGLLISITLFIAVIIDLTLLPVLLIVARKTLKSSNPPNDNTDQG